MVTARRVASVRVDRETIKVAERSTTAHEEGAQKVGRASRRALASVTVLLLACGAWIVLAVGAVAPLTPSEGLPSLSNVGIFTGLPVAMLLLAQRWATS